MERSANMLAALVLAPAMGAGAVVARAEDRGRHSETRATEGRGGSSLAATLGKIERVARELDGLATRDVESPKGTLATAGRLLARFPRLREDLRREIEREREATARRGEVIEERFVTLRRLASRLEAAAAPEGKVTHHLSHSADDTPTRAGAARRLSRTLVRRLAQNGEARLREELDRAERRREELARYVARLDTLEVRAGGLLEALEVALARSATALRERSIATGELVDLFGREPAIDGRRIGDIVRSLEEAQRALFDVIEAHVEELERQANERPEKDQNRTTNPEPAIDIDSDIASRRVRGKEEEDGGSP